MRTPQRRGFTLTELLIAMAVMGIVGSALTRLILAHNRFFSQQDAIRDARSVSRASLNVILSDLRMVDANGGVVAASPTQVTIRVPYAFGVVCSASGASTVVSLLPTDSVMFAGPGFSGYAWRNEVTGAYTYVAAGSVTAGNESVCSGQSITTLPAGLVLLLTPGAAAAAVATPVFLFRQVQYSFQPSVSLPGKIGLWRTLVTGGTSEELVAPFQSSARFRFYVLDSNSAQSAVPTLSDIRGLELVLDGASANTVPGRSAPATFDMTTAVFFKNRLN